MLLSGGAEGSRTPDLLIANETLYQLSYDPAPMRREDSRACLDLQAMFSLMFSLKPDRADRNKRLYAGRPGSYHPTPVVLFVRERRHQP